MDYQSIGQKISELRALDNISQEALANRVGISRATINALENGRSGDVGIRKIIKILDFFDCQLSIAAKSELPVFEDLIND